MDRWKMIAKERSRSIGNREGKASLYYIHIAKAWGGMRKGHYYIGDVSKG